MSFDGASVGVKKCQWSSDLRLLNYA